MIVRYDPGQKERIIRANWMFEDHDSDWDGIPNRMDSSPLGIPIQRGFRGISFRGMDYDPIFYKPGRQLR